jgi:FAD/FMN-containing dehydrogenase
MNMMPFLTLDRDVRQLRQPDLEAFSRQLDGALLSAADDAYHDARKVWNATVDRRPALIARCASEADVQAAVRFAAAHRMLVSVRGGGHHIAGHAVAEGGLMIDLSGLRAVQVDAEQRTATVAAGALLGDVDQATQAHGLAVPLGINSTTGVAGLTLGGGFGWLSRRHGLTIDNLLSARIVTADGSVRVASSEAHPDLFWALRGGGGNFGIVTSFDFKLHPVGPAVYSGLVVYPFNQARKVLHAWRAFTADAPDELSVWAVLRKAPPLPFLPVEVHGQEVVVMALLYSGAAEEGERVAAPVLRFGEPLGVAVGPNPYAGFQTAFDPLLAPGGRNYWKSNNFSTISDAAIDVIVASAAALPGPECEVFVAQLGGAVERVAADATAYAGRDARFIMNVHGRWADPGDDERVRTWARQVFQQTAPHATGSGYVNFLTEDEGERSAAAYGVNHARLQAIKRRYDPGNLFRMNVNIAPAGARDMKATV